MSRPAVQEQASDSVGKQCGSNVLGAWIKAQRCTGKRENKYNIERMNEASVLDLNYISVLGPT